MINLTPFNEYYMPSQIFAESKILNRLNKSTQVIRKKKILLIILYIDSTQDQREKMPKECVDFYDFFL